MKLVTAIIREIKFEEFPSELTKTGEIEPDALEKWCMMKFSLKVLNLFFLTYSPILMAEDPTNLLMSIWEGWYGFNVGSAFQASRKGLDICLHGESL